MNEDNLIDAAETAADKAVNAIERSNKHGNKRPTTIAQAVVRTYLEDRFDDEEQISEAQGIALRRLERRKVVEGG